MSNTGGASARAGIAASMGSSLRDERLIEPDHFAVPPERPSEHAQWDEVHARWIEWVDSSQQWVPCSIDTPTEDLNNPTSNDEDSNEPDTNDQDS